MPLITLTIVFICNLYYLYLLDAHYGKIFGVVFQDFALVLAIFWGSYYWIKMIKLPNPEFRYKKWMISFLILAFLSSVQSTILFDQKFIRGFAPQRWVLIWALIYFPIRKLIFYQKITFRNILYLTINIGIIQLVLFISQYLLKSHVEFMYVTEGYRNGRIRYYYSPILLDWIFFVLLDVFSKSKGIKKWFSIFCVGMILFETMVIQQFRLTTIGLIICSMLFFILVREKKDWKVLYLIIGAIVFFALLNTSMVRNVLYMVLNGKFDGGMEIRSVGRILYFKTIFKHPLLGGGYPSSFYSPAANAAGMNNLIYLYDNGVFGFMYIYGLIGLVWVITLWRRIILDGYQIQKKTRNLSYFLFPIFFSITCINELHWYWEYGFIVFSLYLSMMESKYILERTKIESRSYRIGFR